jgi:Mrp family chromosome partitioning ATPase
MTTLGLTPEIAPVPEPQRITSIREVAANSVQSRVSGTEEEQIQTLVQQLFFKQGPLLVRHVGFAAIEAQTATSRLCLEVALALAESGSYDVGLIDARLQSAPLHTELNIPAGNRSEASWLIADRLWLAPRRRWLDDNAQRVWDPGLTRLRSLTLEFDFSILCFDPVSWLTTRLSQTCQGMVILLTANKTRRLVAAQVQEQLQRARVPLLGTVLVDRRFPIPSRLYRNL